jgi:hypothetical protein
MCALIGSSTVRPATNRGTVLMNYTEATQFGQAIDMAFPPRLSPGARLAAVTLVAWIVLGIFVPWHSLGDGASSAVSISLLVWGWVLWIAVAIALLVPSPLSATVVHVISPLAVVCAALAVDAPSLFAALVAFIVVRSAVLMDYMVQGGAYGLEQRFALRTPVPFMAPAVLAWVVLMGTVFGSTFLLATQQWWIGTPLGVLAIVALGVLPRRLHRLSRRWLVIVPSGIVVHDHLILAETMMSPRNKIASLATVDTQSDSADFTGGVLGPRLAIELREPDKIVLSKITARTLGTTEALHVRSFHIAPRRINAVRATLNF